MPPDPSRTTTAGRVFNDLRSRAKRDGRSTDELLVFYVLERFLYRVTQSHYADQLVLKGGLLLAALGARRATRDADLLGLDLDGSAQHVMTMVRNILVVECDDGIVFHTLLARADAIREGASQPGVRVTVPCAIGKARVTSSSTSILVTR
jgi:hypothetical protein